MSHPAPGKQSLRKDLQEPLFAQVGKRSSQEEGKRTSCREKEALLSLDEQAARVCETCLVPYWPQLRHCMFIPTRTQDYLDKGLGADF
jgi:hypothetical protein